MGEQQIINVLNLAKYNQLELLQSKVEYLANEVKMLEEEKTKCTNDMAILNNRRDEYMKAEYVYTSHLQQLGEEIDQHTI
jgi:prefoldin subunit 5